MLGSMALQSSAAALRSAATSMRVERRHLDVREQAAVEPGDALDAEQAALAHGVEQRRAGARRSAAGSMRAVADQPLEQAGRQQARRSARRSRTGTASGSATPPRGATPAARRRSAVLAKACAASSVIWRLVRAGPEALGRRVKQRRSSARCAGSARSSRRTTWRSLGVPLKWVWISVRRRSLTTSSGGLSSASAYIMSCLSAGSSGRLRRLVFPGEAAAPEHVGEAALPAEGERALLEHVVASRPVGDGTPSSAHSSMKCCCAPWRSLRAWPGPPGPHLAMKS